MVLVTARLTLKPQTQSDTPALFAILSDPQAMRFWHRPPITRLAVAEDLVAEQQAAVADGLCRYWTVWEGDDAIGSVDLSLIRDQSAELGFLLRRDRWALGLAGEAVGAVIAHGFGAMDLQRLAAVAQAQNRAAARVLEKNGFTKVETRAVAIASGEKRDCSFFVLPRK